MTSNEPLTQEQARHDIARAIWGLNLRTWDESRYTWTVQYNMYSPAEILDLLLEHREALLVLLGGVKLSWTPDAAFLLDEGNYWVVFE